MIDEPNAEADEAHDIVRKQRESAVGYQPIKPELSVIMQKAAMFEELLCVVQACYIVATIEKDVAQLSLLRPIIDKARSIKE